MDLEALRPTDEEEIEMNMSPMIDMVFLLLIFFIVASNVIDDKVNVDIPSAVYAQVPKDITGRKEITVTADGTIYSGSQTVTMEELQAEVETELGENEDLRIEIRADGNLRYETTEKIMEALGEVGATDLIFTAYEQMQEGGS